MDLVKRRSSLSKSEMADQQQQKQQDEVKKEQQDSEGNDNSEGSPGGGGSGQSSDQDTQPHLSFHTTAGEYYTQQQRAKERRERRNNAGNSGGSAKSRTPSRESDAGGDAGAQGGMVETYLKPRTEIEYLLQRHLSKKGLKATGAGGCGLASDGDSRSQVMMGSTGMDEAASLSSDSTLGSASSAMTMAAIISSAGLTMPTFSTSPYSGGSMMRTEYPGLGGHHQTMMAPPANGRGGNGGEGGGGGGGGGQQGSVGRPKKKKDIQEVKECKHWLVVGF